MNTDAPPTEASSCTDCDLGAVEELACTAKRFQKQADVVNESLEKITEDKTRFATAREDYQSARDAVAADVASIRTQLTDLLGQLRCRLDDDKERCLEKAVTTVITEIRACAGTPGCCVGECHFDGSPGESPSVAELTARIEEYRREVARDAACFDTLLTEQTAIAERVAALKAEVAAIAAAMAADTPAKDWVRLFARALVAQWRLKPRQLWQGYDTVNDYVDCLCRALMCMLQGWEAIATLEGVRAELDCKAQAATDACTKKQQDMVGEVLRVYVCECPPDDPPDDDPPDEPEHESDCGCGHDHGSSQAS